MRLYGGVVRYGVCPAEGLHAGGVTPEPVFGFDVDVQHLSADTDAAVVPQELSAFVPMCRAFRYSVLDGEVGFLHASGEVNVLASCVERLAVDSAPCSCLRRGAKATGSALLERSRQDSSWAVEVAAARLRLRSQRLGKPPGVADRPADLCRMNRAAP